MVAHKKHNEGFPLKLKVNDIHNTSQAKDIIGKENHTEEVLVEEIQAITKIGHSTPGDGLTSWAVQVEDEVREAKANAPSSPQDTDISPQRPLRKVLTDEERSLMRVQKHDTIAEVIHRDHQVTGRRKTPRIVEMMCVQRLPTRDRPKAWAIIQEEKCLFCDGKESMRHLFFECCYSSAMRRKILMYNHEFHQPKGWPEELAKLIGENSGKSLRNRLMRLSFCYSIYHIGLKRNSKVFDRKERTVENLVFACITLVRNCVYSWKNCSYTKQTRKCV
ncbi:hypothetical protein LIER_35150 [Lithospermum erythrorhizon]|uniref:Reverse transcriptase zinc-binding domain-containing protein n=1 Tax=Lithospermum erythrorhizon TaxID=34254 RepID=A0AAV3NLU0_LITER